jgi:hypothetical protein
LLIRVGYAVEMAAVAPVQAFVGTCIAMRLKAKLVLLVRKIVASALHQRMLATM